MKPCDMTHPVEYASPSLLLTWFASHHPHVGIGLSCNMSAGRWQVSHHLYFVLMSHCYSDETIKLWKGPIRP